MTSLAFSLKMNAQVGCVVTVMRNCLFNPNIAHSSYTFLSFSFSFQGAKTARGGRGGRASTEL